MQTKRLAHPVVTKFSFRQQSPLFNADNRVLLSWDKIRTVYLKNYNMLRSWSFFTEPVKLSNDNPILTRQCADYNESNARELALMPLSRKVKVDVNRVVIHSYRVSIAAYSRARSHLTWLRPIISVCTSLKDESWTQYAECSVFEWVRGSGRCLPKYCILVYVYTGTFAPHP